MSPIDQVLDFIVEIEKLKDVHRKTRPVGLNRYENSAEHSWHVCLSALMLKDFANEEINIDRVIKMLLIHDLVEIDAGDNPIHGNHDVTEQARVEQMAADRIFGLLPGDQRDSLRALWNEFEAAESDDAIFAKSVDRVQPVISNLETGGGTWPEYNVTQDQLETRVGVKVARGAPALWEHLRAAINDWFSAR